MRGSRSKCKSYLTNGTLVLIHLIVGILMLWLWRRMVHGDGDPIWWRVKPNIRLNMINMVFTTIFRLEMKVGFASTKKRFKVKRTWNWVSLLLFKIQERMFRFFQYKFSLLNILNNWRNILSLTEKQEHQEEGMRSTFVWGSKLQIWENPNGLILWGWGNCTLICLLTENSLLEVQKIPVGRSDQGDP